nr:unnamed protein product [Callosobruchus analis]
MARKFLTDKELEAIILNDSDFEEGPRVSAGLEDSDSDLSDAESEHTDHDTDSEQEFSDGDNIQDNLDDAMSGDVSNQETSSSSYFYGKSRYKWSRDPPTRDRRTPAHNIVTHLPGLRGSARLTNPTTPLQAWQLLFTDEILEVILKHTNAKITELSAKYHSENVTYVNHLINSRTLYIAAKPEDKMTRKKFNVLLGKALIQEHLQERLSLNISREMKNIIRKVLGIAEQNQPDATDLQPPPAKRMRCVLCPRSKDRKTPMTCSKCRKPICKQHAQQRFVCNACTTASEMWSDGV